VLDPQEVFDLLRDTWANAPIPKDARFEAISTEKKGRDSFICFYFSTDSAGREQIIIKPTDVNFSPLAHCITLKPQLFLDILKYWFDGMVPSDAEATGLYINKFFNYICLEAQSEKFPAAEVTGNLPLLHLRYEASQVYALDEQTGKSMRTGI